MIPSSNGLLPSSKSKFLTIITYHQLKNDVEHLIPSGVFLRLSLNTFQKLNAYDTTPLKGRYLERQLHLL